MNILESILSTLDNEYDIINWENELNQCSRLVLSPLMGNKGFIVILKKGQSPFPRFVYLKMMEQGLIDKKTFCTGLYKLHIDNEVHKLLVQLNFNIHYTKGFYNPKKYYKHM